MELALKNLIISELTCQEWKQPETLTKPELSAEEKKCLDDYYSIELPSKAVIEAHNYHSNN